MKMKKKKIEIWDRLHFNGQQYWLWGGNFNSKKDAEENNGHYKAPEDTFLKAVKLFEFEV